MNDFSSNANLNSSYIKWLLEILGPVLLGSKPSEIISIPNFDKNKDQKLNDISTYFRKCKNINFIVIDNYGYKILFINRKSLYKILNNFDNKYFLKSLGYPHEVNIDTYLDILITKLKSNTFPDEIGVFLGYPLKDVLGFMGYGKYELFDTRYWKIYGDPKPSYNLYLNFLNERSKIKEMLKTQDIDTILSNF